MTKSFPSRRIFFYQKVKSIDFIKKMKNILKLREYLTVSKYQLLDTNIPKLRRKYPNLKVEWRRLTDRCKNGSGLSLEEPK